MNLLFLPGLPGLVATQHGVFTGGVRREAIVQAADFEKGDRSNLCDDHASMVPAFGPFRQIGPVPFFLQDTRNAGPVEGP